MTIDQLIQQLQQFSPEVRSRAQVILSDKPELGHGDVSYRLLDEDSLEGVDGASGHLLLYPEAGEPLDVWSDTRLDQTVTATPEVVEWCEWLEDSGCVRDGDFRGKCEYFLGHIYECGGDPHAECGGFNISAYDLLDACFGTRETLIDFVEHTDTDEFGNEISCRILNYVRVRVNGEQLTDGQWEQFWSFLTGR